MVEIPLRLMVVDDHPDCGVSLAMLLRMCGHQASTYQSARQTLQELQTVEPHALLVDLGMPGIDGYALAVAVKHLYPHVPVIAVTGYADSASRQKAAEAGIDHFFTKPVDLASLLDTLQRLSLPRWNPEPKQAL